MAAQASVTTTPLHRDQEGADIDINDIWTFEETLASLPMPPLRIRSIGALISVVLLWGCERAATPPPPLCRQHGVEPAVPEPGGHAVGVYHGVRGRGDAHLGHGGQPGGHQQRRVPRHLHVCFRT